MPVPPGSQRSIMFQVTSWSYDRAGVSVPQAEHLRTDTSWGLGGSRDRKALTVH